MPSATSFLFSLFSVMTVMLTTSALAGSDMSRIEVLSLRPSLSAFDFPLGAAKGGDGLAAYRVAVANTNAPSAVPKVTRAPAKVSLGVFASTAISAARLPANAKYRDVASGDYRALFSADCEASGLKGCDTPFARRLGRVAEKARGLGTVAMLSLVNREVNRAVQYSSDKRNWGTGDYWATPSEIALKGAGDCEDYAIAKLWMLRAFGLPADRMQVVVLTDVERRVFHAVLVVHEDGEAYVLDNLSESVRTDRAYPNYVPIMSFVGNRSYVHGFETPTTAMAYSGDLLSVRPGEGL